MISIHHETTDWTGLNSNSQRFLHHPSTARTLLRCVAWINQYEFLLKPFYRSYVLLHIHVLSISRAPYIPTAKTGALRRCLVIIFFNKMTKEYSIKSVLVLGLFISIAIWIISRRTNALGIGLLK